MLVTEHAGRWRDTAQGRADYEPVPSCSSPTSRPSSGSGPWSAWRSIPPSRTTGYYYVFYTPGPIHFAMSSRGSRPWAIPRTSPTEVVIYRDTEVSSDFHHGGGLAFGTDGPLFIATGDGGDPSRVSHASQLLTSPRARCCELNADGTVPSDNPFHDGPAATSMRSGRWVCAIRTACRSTPLTGQIHIYDVGGGSWEEVNVWPRGANYGWPICEGSCATAGHDRTRSFTYSHQRSRRRDRRRLRLSRHGIPGRHQGNLFYGDYVQSWIRRVTFSGAGSGCWKCPFEPADGAADGPTGNVVDLDVGPDGALYYVNIGGGAIHRISSLSDDRPPEIAAGERHADERHRHPVGRAVRRRRPRSRWPGADLHLGVRRRHHLRSGSAAPLSDHRIICGRACCVSDGTPDDLFRAADHHAWAVRPRRPSPRRRTARPSAPARRSRSPAPRPIPTRSCRGRPSPGPSCSITTRIPIQASVRSPAKPDRSSCPPRATTTQGDTSDAGAVGHRRAGADSTTSAHGSWHPRRSILTLTIRIHAGLHARAWMRPRQGAPLVQARLPDSPTAWPRRLLSGSCSVSCTTSSPAGPTAARPPAIARRPPRPGAGRHATGRWVSSAVSRS